MRSADDLRRLSMAVRNRELRTDDQIITDIESDVHEYRGFLADPRPQLPPAPLAELLPLIGWLIYETTWEAVQRVATAFESLSAAERVESDIAYGQIRRLADAARQLPWPEFAPRALGAIRSLALAESKRDAEAGYDEAWIVHQEARKRHKSYLDSHGGDIRSRERFIRDLDEVLPQLGLSETGTACRTAERVISRWAEDLAVADPEESAANESRWIQRMHRELLDGVRIGEEAITAVRRVKEHYGLVDKVDEERLAMRTGFQNPGIMTARAALLTLALCPEMERLGRTVPDKGWPQVRADLLERFERAYRFIEEPVIRDDGTQEPMRPEHQRSLVQLRLNLALLMPGYDLPSRQPFDPCLELNPLDDKATRALSGWLATKVNGRRRGDANAIGSATMPSFISSVAACRSFSGVGSGYHEWRTTWFELDRFAGEEGRKERVTAALDAAGAARNGAG